MNVEDKEITSPSKIFTKTTYCSIAVSNFIGGKGCIGVSLLTRHKKQ